LIEQGEAILEERGENTSGEDFQKIFPLFAIDPDSSPSSPLGSLIGQPAPSDVLRRLAWFYGDLAGENGFKW
jgi:hypothetical protein